MPQLFSRNADNLFRLALVGIVAGVCAVALMGMLIVRSPYETMQNVPRQQPVPFSHEHHVGGLGIDCRYCHTSVEDSAFAGIPETKICLNCHSQMWAVAPVLAPVRDSYRTGRSIEWNRVHDLPGFVYFNHSIHLKKGIGCSTCHGRVDKMPLTWQAEDLRMSWCLNCHRHPEQFVRPRDEVFNIAYEPPPPAQQFILGKELVNEYHIKSLTSCSTCHR